MIKSNTRVPTDIECPWCHESNLYVAKLIDASDFGCPSCGNPYSNQNIESQCDESYTEFVFKFGKVTPSYEIINIRSVV